MEWFNLLVMALFGLAFGSFLNVLVARLPTGNSITGRSRCSACSETLRFMDLIPLLSYFGLKGRCRYCKSPISPRYPAIEALTSLLFVLVYLVVGPSPAQLALYLVYVMAAMVVFWVDFDHTIIPDQIVLPGAALALLAALLGLDPGGPGILMSLLGGVLGSGSFLALFFLTRGGGMGMGDVKLMLFMGLALGPLGLLLSLLVGSFSALGFAGLVMLARRGALSQLESVEIHLDQEEEPEIRERVWGMMIINGKPALPFGPFLSLGFVVSLLWGNLMLDWWLGLI